MVWVTWSESDGNAVTKKHYEFHSDNVYYLLLYNANSGDYLCQVFSEHSPDIPEDNQTASVVLAAGQKFFHGSRFSFSEGSI